MKPRLHFSMGLIASIAVISLFLPAKSFASRPLGKSVLLHENAGSVVRFSVPSGTRTVSLQGWAPKAKRWVQLSTRRLPEGVNSLRVPPRWQRGALRVVATAKSGRSVRTPVAFQVIEDDRAVTFVPAHAGARLYSVEFRNGDASGWQRISTVAAPATGTTAPIRVPLPSTVPSGADLRVMAVSGGVDGSLLSPLAAPMTRGLSAFGGYPLFGALLSSWEAASSGRAASLGVVAGDQASGTTAEVSQSDVWSIRGPRIYFFNQLRGLQIIDIADRTEPRIKGQLDLPAVGEDLYLLGGDNSSAAGAVLVVRSPWRSGEPESTRVLRVGLAGDQPSPEAEIEVPGYLVESRMVGTTLHLVTAAWEENGGAWLPRTWLTSLDLSARPAIIQTRQDEFALSAAQVGATGNYLWMSGPDADDWSSHRLYVWPLRVDGSLGESRSAVLGGVLLDKFKVGDVVGGLAAVVQCWRSPQGDWQQVTAVETLSDNGTAALVPRARLELIRDESLFATRFDGARLYAVTFRQVDPLWLVDLSDPSKPAIVSELEVPGWSSFIEPIGDVLVAIGREGERVQISLFDVSQPSTPKLASRIYLGSSYSWSEAEWDERAVRILRDDGLILLPVSELSDGATSEKVVLAEFDVARRTLRLRGAIDHDFSPRRAALLDRTAIASISNRELLLVDATDRDRPRLTAEISLAFGCEFVAAKGGHVYQIESGRPGASSEAGRAVLRVTSADNLAEASREIRLEGNTAAGAAVFGDRLCIVECDRPDVFALALPTAVSAPDSSSAFLSVWSLADAANPVLIRRFALQGTARGDVALLALSGGNIAVVDRSFDWLLRPMPLLAAGVAPAVALLSDARIGLPWRGWHQAALSVDIVDLSSEVPGALGYWLFSGEDVSGFSRVHSAGDLLAFSFERTLPSNSTATGLGASSVFPPSWSADIQRTSLQILDLADPASPMPWSPVEMPGELLGLAWLQRGGGVVFAKSGEARDRVAALGFDGERATLAAEVEVGSGVVALSGNSLFAAQPGGVREWSFSEQTASWRPGLGWSFRTGHGLDALEVMDGALLATGAGDVWALFEDGAVRPAQTAGPGDIGRAVQNGNAFLIPAGDYGTLTLPAAP